MSGVLPPGSLRLGFDLEVSVGGIPLPPIQNRSVAALLIGLVDLKGQPVSRNLAAIKLYPGSSALDARNALRMTLSRLSAWIGGGYLVKDRRQIALLGVWDLTFLEERRSTADVSDLRSHPWVAEILAKNADRYPLLASRFVEVVDLALEQDPDLARSMLVGAREMWGLIPYHDLARLLAATAPVSPDRPLAFEYRRLVFHYKTEWGQLFEAVQELRRAYRVIQLNGDLMRQAQCLSLLSTAAVEMGNMSLAAQFLRDLSLMNTVRDLDYYNALACFHWGEGNHDAAAQAIRTGMKLDHSRFPEQRERFLVNSGYFYSEVGDIEASASIEEMLSPSSAMSPLRQQWRAYRLAHLGYLDEAEKLLLGIWNTAYERQQRFPAIYAAEAYADTLAKRGKGAEARNMWVWSEKARVKCGGGQSPRLKARAARIARA